MSTYIERSILHGEQVEARRTERRSRDRSARGGPSALAVAGAELWKRTFGGSFERLPDPATHPECWFKIV
jgi:hypothetical protein